MNRYKRTSALPAIAAALALSSTPVLAQEVQPVPTDPAPAAQSAPTAPTTTDATPSTTDTSATAQPDSATADGTTSTHVAAAKPVVRRTAAKATPTVTRTAVRTAAVRTAASVAAPAVATAAPATAPATTASVSRRPAPIVNLNANPPAATPAVAPKPAHHKKDATLPIAGGALAFLAIGGAAAAITRRRHDDEEEWVDDEPMSAESVEPSVAEEPVIQEEQPTIVAPAAFAWEGAEQARDGETYVERAQRGPTPENPSLSLKKRLKRAAALDKRESDVAAGKAEPMDPMAGLPEAMAD